MAKVAIVTYKVKEDNVEENIKYIEKVFKKLQARSPEGVHYASTIHDDAVTFTHIAFFASDKAQEALTSLPEFQSFQKDLKDRCEVPPTGIFTDLVGGFGILDKAAS